MPVIELPFHGKAERPRLQATIRFQEQGRWGVPRPVPFLLDTGSDITMVGKEVWGLLRKPPKAIAPPRPIHGIGGRGVGDPVGPVRISVSDVTHVHVFEVPVVYLLREEEGQASGHLLGRDFFEEFAAIVSFDFRRKVSALDFGKTTASVPIKP